MEEIKIPDNWEPYEWMDHSQEEKTEMSILRFYNHLAMAMIYGGKDKKYSLRQIVFNIIRMVEYEHKYKWTDPVTEEFKKEVIPGDEKAKNRSVGKDI